MATDQQRKEWRTAYARSREHRLQHKREYYRDNKALCDARGVAWQMAHRDHYLALQKERDIRRPRTTYFREYNRLNTHHGLANSLKDQIWRRRQADKRAVEQKFV